jgi:hypothetical protein
MARRGQLPSTRGLFCAPALTFIEYDESTKDRHNKAEWKAQCSPSQEVAVRSHCSDCSSRFVSDDL